MTMPRSNSDRCTVYTPDMTSAKMKPERYGLRPVHQPDADAEGSRRRPGSARCRRRTTRRRARSRPRDSPRTAAGPARARGSAARPAARRRNSSPECRSSAAGSAPCWRPCCSPSRALRLPSSDPLPNFSGSFDQRLRLVVGDERGERAARARRQPFDRADGAADRLRARDLLHHRKPRQTHADRRARLIAMAGRRCASSVP